MPNQSVKKLDKSSTMPSMKAALTSCIDEEMGNGHKQPQAIAMCYQMIETKTGKSMGHSSKTPAETALEQKRGNGTKTSAELAMEKRRGINSSMMD